ncbi:MAG: molybdopterin oxidoreductase family protein [Stagnimonas sp.]|nr:molybdopterin oxidoreductase family protein [Stagnimonas sp.]
MSEPRPASEPEVRTHYGACNLCEAICGLEFKVQGRKILSIRGDEADPLSRGHICPKAVALRDLYEDPDRLRKPLRRTESGWQEMDWDAAFELVAERLAGIIKAHGGNAVGAYLGNPSVHNYGHLTHAPALLRQLQTRNRYSATSVDQLPSQLMSYWLYGHQLLLAIPDLDRTQYFFVLGANPMASNGSLMTVPDFRNRVKALHARGGRMVVIDPRRSETAEVADEHHFIRPGGDAWLLLAMLQVIFAERLEKPGRLAEWLDGLDEVRAAVAPFTPERAAPQTGIAAEDIRRLAREFAAAEAAVCYGRMGVSVQAFGSVCQWAIQLLNLVTGNFDRAGGAMFTSPALDLIDSPASRPGHFGKWQSRVSGLPEFGGELPVAVLAEEILTPGEGQIRAMVTMAGNPILSTPNGAQLDRAFAQLEFMVSLDIYLNETTRHADVILPPTSALEHDHYDLIFHHFAVRNSARYNQPLFEKPADARHDWEILSEVGQRLATKLGNKPQNGPRPDQVVDFGLQSGPYGAARRSPDSSMPPLSLKTLKEHPHGIDLGPLQPSLPGRLRSEGQRIRCAVPLVLADIERLAALPETAAGLRLIGRRHVRSNNSWMHNSERLVKGKPRHQLLMHPADLAARGLADGAPVRVRSRVGEITVEVQSSVEMMPGVVSLPHGWGHAREGVRLGVAQAHAGVSVNDLTDERELDAVSGNAALNGLAVEVLAA